jgi:hypothetical protein
MYVLKKEISCIVTMYIKKKILHPSGQYIRVIVWINLKANPLANVSCEGFSPRPVEMCMFFSRPLCLNIQL